MASKALFAALEFDLFTHIARGADSNGALAVATGIAENRLVTLLAALKSVGLISEAGGRLVNAPATARYLVAGAPGDFRDYVRLVNDEFGYESFRYPHIRENTVSSEKPNDCSLLREPAYLTASVDNRLHPVYCCV
jgi:2-hydroxy-4-(methylsulfanyl)butanoate S-methyltransferase